MSYKVILYLQSWFVGHLLACWGSTTVKVGKGMLDPNNREIWSGWAAPAGAEAAWKEWLDLYNQQNGGKGQPYDPALHGDKPYGHGIKGWPQDWGGLGPPMGGMRPPPWAYVPKNMGKPPFCYLKPEAGNCTSKLGRYGYNGFMNECQYFEYTGCGGNRNNFEKLESCQAACMSTPQSGCDSDSHMPIEDYKWARRCGWSDDQPTDYVDIKDN